MDIHLPAELRAICDLSTLKLESGSFVEDDLRQYFSDVLYSLKTTDGADGYVHVLIEHQSSPDKHMAFRLIRYAVAAMQRHLDAGHKKLRWSFRYCSTPANAARTLTRPTGCRSLMIRHWPGNCTPAIFRWLM